MPLTRGARWPPGRGKRRRRPPVHVTMNVSTPDADGFRRSQTQIAAQLGRAMARGQRNR